MRRPPPQLRLMTLAAVLGGGLWLACGDGYQSDEPLTGDTGAKCFPDGTCKAGLICLSNLCVAPPDSGTTSSSSSSGGGTIDAGDSGGGGGDSEGGAPGCPQDETLGIAPGVACESPRKCDPGLVCCPRVTTTWECVAGVEKCGGGALQTHLDCDSPADCPPAEQCCFAVNLAPTKCTDGTLVSGACATTCPAGTFAVCEPGHACATGPCTDRTIVLQRSTRVLRRGLCPAGGQ